MRLKRGKNRQVGFILIEGLVTFMVLTVGMVSVAKFQGDILDHNAGSKTQTQAVNLAQEKIEELRNYADNAGYALIDTGADTPQSYSGSNTTFSRSWTVVPNTDPVYDTVTVTVAWNDASGDEQSAELTSIIASTNPVESAQQLLIDGYLDGDSGDSDSAHSDSGDSDSGDDDSGSSDSGSSDSGSSDSGDSDSGDDDSDSGGDSDGNPITSTTTTTTAVTTTTLSTYNLTISGSINTYGNTQNMTVTVSASGNYGTFCADSLSGYSCTIGPIPSNDSWTGSVSVNTNKTYCSNNPASPTPYVGININQSQGYNIGLNAQKCP